MELQLNDHWELFQDVQEMGETMQVWKPGFCAGDQFFHCLSNWEPLPRLAQLQCLFSEEPYSGRALRQFNAAPWWYRKTFSVEPSCLAKGAALRFESIDYFARVYLNGELLGEHEGYFAPAEFEVGGRLLTDGPNTLVVRVWSPFDDRVVSMKQGGMEVGPMFRFLTSEKNMMKGTYDHADGFFQRDVNPIGIYGDVSIRFYDAARFAGEPSVRTETQGNKAEVFVEAPVFMQEAGTVRYAVDVLHPLSAEAIVSYEKEAVLQKGKGEIKEAFVIENPLCWTLWDRGTPHLYGLRVRLLGESGNGAQMEYPFGIRSAAILRDEATTAFLINEERVFLRGTSYFPDVYLSRMTPERYESDLLRMKSLGFNAVRVHVHVARPAFYALCDRLGMAVIQDSDLSWFHSASDAFIRRAGAIFEDMVRMLRRHPAIICWIVMNEPDLWKVAEENGLMKLDEKPVSMMDDRPGPQLVAALKQLDPTRPYIKGSHFTNDPESGDTHDYTGSITGGETHYFDNYGKRFKLLSEFGMDLPGDAENLRSVPKYYERIKPVYEDKDAFKELCEYRRRYLKYVTEYCRIQKKDPCSGYFQFLFSDVSPQSFYGLTDWWGTLKCDADYCLESNQPVGVFMEYTKDAPVAIWAANDTPADLPGCSAEWYVTDENGAVVTSGKKSATLPADGVLRIEGLTFGVSAGRRYNVRLLLTDAGGRLIAQNHYSDVLRRIEHPKGHPLRIDHELGMRLYWA